jgi:hypothetical protein
MAGAREEPDQNAGHREFIPASVRQQVRAMLPPQEATGFETAKRHKHRAVTPATSKGGRMRISRHKKKQPSFRHAST